MNPFAVFGLSPCFDFDSEQLTRTYRDLSRVVHPDRFGGASASERLRALNKAVDVNEAWRLLRDPLSRAEALLRHFDIAVEENKEPPASPALLLEMMDAREGLAEAKHGQDAAAVMRWSAWGQQRWDAILAQLREMFQPLEQGRLGPAEVQAQAPALLSLLGHLRYLQRFLEEVRAVEDDISLSDSGSW